MDWKKNLVFRNLSEGELFELAESARHVDVLAGQNVFQEGDVATDLYVLVRGTAEVFKHDAKTGAEAVLSKVSDGAVIGEMAMLDRGKRSASIRAVERCEFLVIAYDALIPPEDGRGSAEQEARLRSASMKILYNLAAGLSTRLRASNADRLTEAVDRLNMALFVLSTVALLDLYIFILAFLPSMKTRISDTTFLSIPLLAVFGLTALYFVRKSGLQLQAFGLGRHNLRRALIEGALLSIPFMALIALGKWFYLRSDPSQAGTPLLEWRAVLAYYGPARVAGTATIYAIFTFVQEFITRSGLQTPLERFLPGKHRAIIALVMSNLQFATTHLHVSVKLAVMVFFAGLFWGYLYRRHGSLFGCALNHAIVGTFIFFVLGIDVPK